MHGPGTDEPLVWYEGAGTTAKGWLYADHLGSIVAVANSAGASTATYRYGPYGEPDTFAGAMRFRYTGQQLIGELGLYHYKARAYSPALGRFLQTDPIGYLDDMNLYAYVGNNPLNRVDPTGLAMVKTEDPNMVQTSMAIVPVVTTVAAALAVCQGMPTCREGLAAGMGAIRDWMLNEGADNASDTKPPLSDYKDALDKVHDEVGKLPKGEDGKFGSPQAGDSKKGYRLDPPHDGAAQGDAESKYHFNWWDYTGGKRGKGGRSGAIPIGD